MITINHVIMYNNKIVAAIVRTHLLIIVLLTGQFANTTELAGGLRWVGRVSGRWLPLSPL